MFKTALEKTDGGMSCLRSYVFFFGAPFGGTRVMSAGVEVGASIGVSAVEAGIGTLGLRVSLLRHLI